MKKNLDFDRSTFWQSYLKVAFSLLIILLAGGILLSLYLGSYEKSRSIHLAEETFTRYFKKGKYEEALKKAGYQAGETEDIKTVAKALKEQAKTKVFDLCAVKTEGDIDTYYVVLTAPTYIKETQKKENIENDIKVAQMRFKQTKEKNLFGFSSWEFLDIKFSFQGDLTVTCAIPSTHALYANGTKVSEEHITSQEYHPWNQHIPQESKGIILNVYQLSDFYLEPSLVCQNEEGEKTKLTKNEKTQRWEAIPFYQGEMDEGVSNQILKGMKEYARYNQKDVPLSSLAPYFVTDGPFYKEAAQNTYIKVWEHDNSEFKNEVIEDFYFFDENTLSCHVSFDQVLKQKGREDYIDSLDMTVFAKKEGGTWLIFDHAER